jgi:menaquinone-dependent protoporphyrinogen oxidase
MLQHPKERTRSTQSNHFTGHPLLIFLLLFLAATSSSAATLCLTDTIYRGSSPLSKHILVAYATRAGSTMEIADSIGKILSETGAMVDVRPVSEVASIEAYQAVVLGSAIRMGTVLPELMNFVKAHKEELRRKPTAVFVVCLTLKTETPENRTIVAAYLDPLREEIEPLDAGLFAGKMAYEKLGFLANIIARRMVNAPEGDFRNWPLIREWAKGLVPILDIR